MKMVIFNIKKGDKCKEYNLDIHTTIEDLKNKIISDFSLPVKYIDIEFLLCGVTNVTTHVPSC